MAAEPHRMWQYLPAPKVLQRAAWWVAIVFLIDVLIRFLSDAAQFLLWVFVLAGIAIWTIVVAIDACVRAWNRRQWPVSALATALIVPAMVFTLWNPLGRGAILVHFLIDRPAYDRVVSGLERGTITREQAGPAQDPPFRVDAGEPLRVAFPTFEGMVDNWAGVVYDPTHSVRQAKGFGSAVPGRVRELFGGDVVSCWHLAGAYYMCSFT
jgi:hypothetical protein